MQQSGWGESSEKVLWEAGLSVIEPYNFVSSVNRNKIHARRLFLGLFNHSCC